MHYEKLIKIYQDELIIAELPFEGNNKGFYADNVIAINSTIETSAEKACVLAEEIGHHFTSAGNILDQGELVNRKQEKLARNWAYRKLVPIGKIIAGYRYGCKNRYELAKYIGVTEEFLMNSINYYKEKYGLYYQTGKYLLCFDPLYIGEKFLP